MRLFHPKSNSWIRVFSSGKPMVHIPLSHSSDESGFVVGSNPNLEDKDTFLLVKVPSNQTEDMWFATGTANTLRLLLEKVKATEYDPTDPECLRTTKLCQIAFENIIFFMIDFSSADPMVQAKFVEPRKQNLFREWNCYELMVEFLKIPFREFNDRGWIFLKEASTPPHFHVQKYTQLCFRVYFD